MGSWARPRYNRDTKAEHIGFRVLHNSIKKSQHPSQPVGQTPSPAVAPFDAVQAKAHQKAWADHLGVPVETTNSIGMKFAVIPPGEFMMGSPEDEPGRGNDDETLHKVTLTQPFQMGMHEVTQDQYQKVMGTNPSKFKGPQNPVEQVIWNDAVEFCRKLSEQPEEKSAGYVYRLPTEAEREYVCRAGTTTAFSFGDSDTELGDYAWNDKNSGATTHPVGVKKPNPWGLYDMHGNVIEWCQDWYGDYLNGSMTDPTGAASGSYRVNRGGGWSFNFDYCRSANRDRGPPSHRGHDLGFRVVRSSIKKSQPPGSPVGQAPPPAVAPFGATQAKAHQKAWANHLGVPVETTNSIGMKFAVIPAGEFMMGSPEDELGRVDNEQQHEVVLTNAFELGVDEVTQEQYEAVMGTNPSRFQGPQNPVENVSWDDAVEFCRKLSERPEEKLAGYVYRLPTEAEWEYACRAGTTTKYSFGDSDAELGEYAWNEKNSGDTTHPVGQKKPNAWGLYDMHGNVYEWCQDRYGDYPSGSVTDPTGPASGDRRVLRGGSFYFVALDVRSARRDHFLPVNRNRNAGFRVLRSSIK